jgi:tRNA pseudouridine13 synthase
VKHEWPYAISDASAIPGTIKQHYADFQVEEIPAYEPSGIGDHVYFLIEKRGLATSRAVRDIARALGVRARDIGVAGMKDARGVTRQMLSLEHVDPQAVEKLDIPRIAVLKVSRHRNKLRMGHLLGNRFTIKVRDTDPSRINEVQERVQILTRRGVPNYYGSQRFGNRGDTWQIGRALLLGEFEEAAKIIAGKPGPDDEGQVLRARELFEAGQYTESLSAWPSGFNECKTLAGKMARFQDDYRRAVMGLDRKILGFYVSAYQSWLFNKVLETRIARFDHIEEGDLAWKHDSGAVFLVESEPEESPRAERFEISPTGPMYGPKMTRPKGAVAELEDRILEQENVGLERFPKSGPLKCPGARRSLRFKPENPVIEVGEDEHGVFISLAFSLPSGCYATSFLREIFKAELVLGG